MDRYYSPYIVPNNRLHNPFPHSLLSTRELRMLLLSCRPLGVEELRTVVAIVPRGFSTV